uniref:Acyl-CoA thioesterase 8 n=1 Tax=Xenopus tropicalis TaxID=8364 RepID=A0A6I8RWI9_XENTR
MAASLQPDDLPEPAKANPSDLRSILVTSVLNLEPLDKDLFRGSHHWVPLTQRLFGGQIVGQALVAAASSVSEDVNVHSLHCYFVRAGDPKIPVLYQVERTRDGRSFSVRSVKAIQHGVPILTCQASFHQFQESPIQHQFSIPTVPPPEELLTREELIQKYLRDPSLVEKHRMGLNKLLAQEVPIEIKPINPPDMFHRIPQEPRQMFWVRAQGVIALLPYLQYRMQFMASLDHSMWFHSPFRADEWMLYECESHWAGKFRGAGNKIFVHNSITESNLALLNSRWDYVEQCCPTSAVPRPGISLTYMVEGR